ncbi:acetamidase/formamidase family protein [Mesorhizobium sp. CN2-181]|uniref:acetamidase/formamidase family protein n=1 Tax=Mesorhizobium yinganensis TaxID=3157707 RepID=UPI0032B83FC7
MHATQDREFVFRVGGHEPRLHVAQGEAFTVFTEDCFSGKLTSVDGEPRKVAPYPRVNPLTGPIHVEGVSAGDIVAIRLISLTPARQWGVATISPDFGLLSGTRVNPNLQEPQDEHVWIWRFSADGKVLETPTKDGRKLRVPYRPFHGTLGVAPAHGEVRLAVAPGDFGGNLDIPDLGPGSTLYLRANVDGAHVVIGDGHYAQGDGEIAGTAIEGAFNTTLMCERVEMDDAFDWPRFENDDVIGVIGCARPLDDACRIAVAGLVRWVVDRTALSVHEAHQLLTQCCRLRIGNLVNPSFSVMCSIDKWVVAPRVLPRHRF